MFDVGQTRRQGVGSVSAVGLADPRLGEWNRTGVRYPHSCIHQLFDIQAAKSPEQIAVRFGGQALTYAELVNRSDQLSSYLRRNGVEHDSLVAVCIERSLDMLVAVLGILKAGAAYVPLDPAYPRERIKDVLADAHVNVLITQAELKASLPTIRSTICIDRDWVEIQQCPVTRLDEASSPEDVAYVIYTSGSTGKPKGVQIEHRSVVNFLTSMQNCPGVESKDVLLAVTTLSFDIAGLEMYLPLISGGTVVVADRASTYDGRKLSRLLETTSATVMQATPATWRLLIESGWKGNRNLKVLCGGEGLSSELARALVSRAGSVWNLYGPTETTIWSSVHRVTGHEKGLVPIGRPIANTQFYIVDDELQFVPIGGEGELLIGGDGLARGYFERPQLTREKFITDPFNPSARLYRTGDLARFHADGVVELLGRIDHQVKIRGFRVELGEIEAVLERHAMVRQAVVTAHGNEGEKQLVAYVVLRRNETRAATELRRHLQTYVPDYMLPSAFVVMDRLPLTPNGKVDRKALPGPRAEDYCRQQDYVPPRNPVEQRLADLWQEVLQVRPIGVTTNLLELGANSLQIARAFVKMSKAFGRDLPLALVFQAQTIERLAAILRPGNSQAFPTLVAVQPNGRRVPLFCVHGGAGTALYLHKLASYLGQDQPVYGLESEGLDGRRIQRRTVEEMAEHYVAEIRKVRPQGPYLLGGYCFGGIVAYEMARRLTEAGETVELVALFNAPLRFNRLRAATTSNLAAGAMEPKNVVPPLARIQAALAWRMRRFLVDSQAVAERTAFRMLPALRIAIPQSLRTAYVLEMTENAERTYHPKSYSGRLTIFRGIGVYDHDAELGWSGLAAKGLEIYDIGDTPQEGRREMINEPIVGKLACQLKSCLAHLENVRESPLADAATCESVPHTVLTTNHIAGALLRPGPVT